MIAVNLSKADQNHGFPKGLRADFFEAPDEICEYLRKNRQY